MPIVLLMINNIIRFDQSWIEIRAGLIRDWLMDLWFLYLVCVNWKHLKTCDCAVAGCF